jgi:hypothetical protein
VPTETTPSPETEETAELPRFLGPPEQPIDEPVEPEEDRNLEGSADRPTTSSPNESRRGEERPESSSRTPSSRTSTDGGYVSEAIPALGRQLAAVVGILLNKLARRKRPETSLWLMTEEEADGIGGSLARAAVRRIPEELGGEDADDLIEAVAATMAYGIRNIAGVTAAEAAEARQVIDSTAREAAPQGQAAEGSPAPTPAPGGWAS